MVGVGVGQKKQTNPIELLKEKNIYDDISITCKNKYLGF